MEIATSKNYAIDVPIEAAVMAKRQETRPLRRYMLNESGGEWPTTKQVSLE